MLGLGKPITKALWVPTFQNTVENMHGTVLQAAVARPGSNSCLQSREATLMCSGDHWGHGGASGMLELSLSFLCQSPHVPPRSRDAEKAEPPGLLQS